jgi:hypothetical protein
VVEGVLLHCQRATTTGTVTVGLSDDGGSTWTREVTVNATDLPPAFGWVFFQFSSTLTADGGNDYKIGIKGSSAGNASFYRDGTAANFARRLRSNSTATIASNDIVYISDNLTGAGTRDDVEVTMDSTSSATTYGLIEIAGGGVLSYGTSASTNYHLKLAGNLSIRGDGTFNIGTVATPIPRTSTAKLEFASTAPSAYFINVNGGTFVAQGLSRTADKDVYYCLLNTNEASGQTVLGVDTDTGWLNGDSIVIAPTGSTATQAESRTLSANATSTELTISSGLTHAHSGTAPSQAEVINLTRNVTIFAASALNTWRCLIASNSTVDLDWVGMYFMGGSGTASIAISNSGASISIDYCAFYDHANNSYAIGMSGTSTVAINYNVFARHGTRTFNNFNGTATYNVIIGTGSNRGYYGDSATLQGTFSNNRLSGHDYGIYTFASANTTFSPNLSNNNFRSCSVAINPESNTRYNIDGCSIINCGWGIYLASTSTEFFAIETTVSNCNIYGCVNGGMYALGAQVLKVQDCNFGGLSGSVGGSSPKGIILTHSSGAAPTITLQSVEFKSAGGVYTAHTTCDIEFSGTGFGTHRVTAQNVLFGASTELNGLDKLGDISLITSAKHDQTAGNHKAWRRRGIITSDSTIYKTASPSERLTPNSASNTLQSGSKFVAIENGTTKTISVWVRESVVGDGTDYNGNRIRLRCRRYDAAGVTSDTTLATATASSVGAWEQLSGTSPAVTDDTVLEFFVDCDGTTGWVNVDDWS